MVDRPWPVDGITQLLSTYPEIYSSVFLEREHFEWPLMVSVRTPHPRICEERPPPSSVNEDCRYSLLRMRIIEINGQGQDREGQLE